MNNRIALVARRKSGKTTAAEALIREGYWRVGLADPVKEAALDMCNNFPLDLEIDGALDAVVERHDIERDKAVFRPLLEWVGVTFGRDYLGTPDRWIRLFERRIRGDFNVVCDDMRLPNEADALRKMGFLIVRIVRPEEERQAALRAAGEPDGLMPSEVDIDRIVPDVTIANDGSVDDLREKMLAVASGLHPAAWEEVA